MRSANEVSCVYTLDGAYIVAGSASGTFIVINNCKIVINLDSPLGTGALAFTAAYTAVGANLTNLRALVVAAALNNNSLAVVYQVNYAVGTSLDTKTAAYALSGVDLCDAFLFIDADSVSGTNLNAIAVTKTCKGTVAIA